MSGHRNTNSWFWNQVCPTSRLFRLNLNLVRILYNLHLPWFTNFRPLNFFHLLQSPIRTTTITINIKNIISEKVESFILYYCKNAELCVAYINIVMCVSFTCSQICETWWTSNNNKKKCKRISLPFAMQRNLPCQRVRSLAKIKTLTATHATPNAQRPIPAICCGLRSSLAHCP